MIDRFVNFFFYDVFGKCILIEDLLYLPLSELSTFMFDFSVFTAVCLFTGFITAEFLALFVPFLYRKLRNKLTALEDIPPSEEL